MQWVTTSDAYGEKAVDPLAVTTGSANSQTQEFIHREQLVHDIYLREGLDLQGSREQAYQFLKELGLEAVDAGSMMLNAQGSRRIMNQCFYLALARSYLGPSTEVSSTALLLKQLIEGAVLSAHPDWVEAGAVGIEVQAFSDFLWYPMRDAGTALSQFAAVVMDSTTGTIELYRGVKHDETVSHDAAKAFENLLLLWYVPGHYQCLSANNLQRSKPRLTLQQIKATLDQRGIAYIETCE